MDSEVTNMLHGMLGKMRVRAKDDPTNYSATLTRGVPQGARSSLVVIIVYIEKLAKNAEESDCVRRGDLGIYTVWC